MGCDIHFYVERKNKKGKWVIAQGLVDTYDDGKPDVPYADRFTSRNYTLFAAIAGVRDDKGIQVYTVRGLPKDVSPEIKKISQEYGEDGHSHSWLSYKELAVLKDKTFPMSGKMNSDQLEKLQKSIAEGKPDWNLLYPYWGASNVKDDAPFEIEVPFSFTADEFFDYLENRMRYYDTYEENIRAVFWFDN